MKTLKLASILTFSNVIIQAWRPLKLINGNFENTSELLIFQNGVEKTVGGFNETIEIDRKEFSLRFYNKRYDAENDKFYSAQIAAFIDKTEFDSIRVGIAKSDLPCFEPGSGMAPSKSGKYESLIFKNSGHHYTTYENSDSKRLKLLEDKGDLLKLEFEITSLYYDSKKIKMKNTKLNEFYIAFLIDANLNGMVDEGELHKVTIKVK
jgi:hypothetical protein